MSALTVSGINITGTLYNSYREQQELINEQMNPPLPHSYLFWFSGYHPPINFKSTDQPIQFKQQN